MKLKPGNFCPMLKEECIGLKCMMFTQVRGQNPQTGEEIDEWSCAITWIPTLLIENSRQQRHTSASVESFRNEMVRTNEAANKVNELILLQSLKRDRLTSDYASYNDVLNSIEDKSSKQE